MMKILINDQRTINEVQHDFSKAFPYLKIEFFKAPHTAMGASSKQQMHTSDKKLGDCRKLHNEGKISIASTETVTQLESDFWNQFGLSVQIFRKSGNVWIETSLTDAWTLERQNREGEEMSASRSNKPEREDYTDRDIWD